MNTLVRVRRVYTDTSGYYSTSKKFLTKVNYTVYFHNKPSGFQIWGNHYCLAPASLSLGNQSNTGYSYDIDQQSPAWFWATVNNATSIYSHVLCPSLGIYRAPTNLRIAIFNFPNTDWNGSAPMLRHWRCASCEYNTYQSFFIYLGTGGLLFFDRTVPDIILFNNSDSTHRIYATVFHELSHASHSVLVNGDYWFHFCMAAVLNNSTGTYGTPNGDFCGYIGVGEMWGFFSEIVFYNENMKNVWHRPNDTSDYREITTCDTTKYWFKPGILRKITGPDKQYISFDSIYRSLNATSISEFKNNMKNRVSSQNAHAIDSIFARHEL